MNWKRTSLILLGLLAVVGWLRLYLGNDKPDLGSLEGELLSVAPPKLVVVESQPFQGESRSASSLIVRDEDEIKHSKSPIETRGEIVDERFVAGDESGVGIREVLVRVPDLDFLVRVLRSVEFDTNTGAERTLWYEEMVADRMIVRIVEEVDEDWLREELKQLNVRLGKQLMDDRLFELRLGSSDLNAIPDFLNRTFSRGLGTSFEFLEPDYIVHSAVQSDDPSFLDGALWGLNNTGQDGGENDVDIDATEAWEIRTDSADIVVAVIDSGINYEHEDLRDNLWTNSGEIAGNGIDDDGNGFVDDVYGINAASGSGDPLDDNGHGSHCAGTIGAVGNNGVGVAGVAWTTRLMGLKFISRGGSGALSDAIECINYAVTNGADVLNNSWGGGGFSQALRDAIAVAGENGVVFVAAAGNASANTDEGGYYPAGYDLANVVSVGAVDRKGELADFSNFGLNSVDIAAPGVDIISCLDGAEGAYGRLSGTSMAAPHVSGILALVMAEFPSDSLAANTNRLRYGAEEAELLREKVGLGALANARGSLSMIEAPFPPEFNVRPASIYNVAFGETIRVEVDVESESPVEFRWFRDGVLLGEVSGPLLQIQESDTSDSGDYRVEVENSDGVAKTYFSIVVLLNTPQLSEAFDAGTRNFYTWGDGEWDVYFSDSIVGATSVRSGPIGDGGRSVLRTKLQGPGLVSFFWRLSAEPALDVGEFRVDAAVEAKLVSEGDWIRQSIQLEEAREYELEWLYTKDRSRAVGQDALFVDGFQFDSLEDSPPVVVTQPISAIIGPGEHHALGVAALGEGLSYQWYKDGQAIDGAIEDVLILLNLDFEDAGEYWVTVSNDKGQTSSSVATLQVAEVPVQIVQSPAGLTRVSGQTARLTVVASGAQPISYQWFKDGQRIVGQTTPELILEDLVEEDEGEYFVRVRNAYSTEDVESETASLVIEDVVLKPVIVKDPVGGYWQTGETLRVSVAAEGTRPFVYQWYKDGEPVEGATERFLERVATDVDSGTYQVVVENGQGQVRSEEAEVVIVGDLSEGLDLPEIEWDLWGAQYFFVQSEVTADGVDALQNSAVDTILSQLHGMEAEVEGPVNFGVLWKQAESAASSRLSLFVGDELGAALSSASDWRRAWVKVPEGGHTLSFEIANEIGSLVWLDAARLEPAPVVYSQPESRVLLDGEPLTLSVEAYGSGVLVYRWFKDGVEISGEAGSEFTPVGLGVDLVGRYRVEIENEHGVVSSETAVIEYLESPMDEIGDGSIDFALSKDSDWEIWRGESDSLALRSKKAGEGEILRLDASGSGPGVLVMELAMSSAVCCPQLEVWVDGQRIAAEVRRNGEFETLGYTESYHALEEGEHTISWVFTGSGDLLEREQFGALRNARITTAPVITQQPADVRQLEGRAVSLSVGLFDDSEVTYQWFREDGSEVVEAKEAVFRIESLVGSDSGNYYCEVTDGDGETTKSDLARIETVSGFHESVGVDFGEFTQGTEFWGPQSEVAWDGGSALSFDSDGAPDQSNLLLALDWPEGRSGSVRFQIRVEGLGDRSFVKIHQPNGKSIKLFEDSDWSEIVLPVNEESSAKSLVFTVSQNGLVGGGALGVWIDSFEFVEYPVVYDEPGNVVAQYGQTVLLEPKIVGSDLRYQWFRDGEVLTGETNVGLELRGGFASRGIYQLHAENDEAEVLTREVAIDLSKSEFGAEVGRRGAFATEGDRLWGVTDDGLPGGGPAFFVEGVTNGESSDLYFVAQGPGTLKFDWRLEQSRNGEKLYCYINDVLVSGIFSEGNWRVFSIDLPESGRYPFRVSLANPDGGMAPGGKGWLDDFRFVKNQANGYGSWAENVFDGSGVPEGQTAKDADSDDDGLANGVEYLLRMDPLVAERFPKPRFLEDEDKMNVVFDFQMNFQARDARVGYEVSDNLIDWYSMDSLLVRTDAESDDATLFARMVEADLDLPIFVRLAIYFDSLE